jgi:molecular chaperone GrpE
MSEKNKNASQDNKETKKKSVNDVDVSKEDTKVQTVEEKLQDSEDKLLRALAEIENQRRRSEKEIKDAYEFGSFNFAKESLAILDNLQRARLAIKNDETLKINKDLGKFLENITIIEKDLVSIFEKNRIHKINTKDKKFDPNFHQAMSEIEDDVIEPGTVLQEMQAGYMLGERLLRPSLVAVAKKKVKNADKKEKNNLVDEKKTPI